MKADIKWFLASLALSAAGITFVLGGLSGGNLLDSLRSIPGKYVLYGIGLSVAMWLIEALRIRAFLDSLGAPLPLGVILRLDLASNFVAGITPASLGGPPAQVYFLKENGVALAKAVAAVSSRVLLTAAFFSVCVPVAMILLRSDVGIPEELSRLVRSFAYLLAAGTVGVCCLARRPALLTTVAESIVRLIPSRLLNAGGARKGPGGIAQRLTASLQLLSRARPSQVFWIVVLTGAFWAAFFSIGPLMLSAFEIEAPLGTVFMRQVIMYFLISYVPLPGGSGVAEIGLAFAFRSFIPAGLLASFVMLWRFLTFLLPVLVGSAFFVYESRKISTNRG